MERFDVLVVGGGAAGMAAALSAESAGARVLLAEHGDALGGVLTQCLHRGFGLGLFGAELTGAEYAARFRQRVERRGIAVRLGTAVVRLAADKTALLSARGSLTRIGFQKCFLACGCRERTLYSLPVGGSRPAGILTAGQAQRLLNAENYEIGERCVILGSGDVGQLVARTLCQRGKTIVAVVEQNAAVGGLARNRRDCLEAYHIPVLLRATVDEVRGAARVESVMVRDLAAQTRRELFCDTLITALGLIPDQALALPLRTGDGALPGYLTLCGNCESVHDIVESVTLQSEALGAAWKEGIS